MSVNKVILLGRIGKDVEQKFSKNGLAIANVSLATTEKLKDGEKTTWHDVVCFGGSAEYLHKRVRTGDQLYVEGRIDKSEYKDKQGNKRTSIKVVANFINHFPGESKQESLMDRNKDSFDEEDIAF